MFSNRRGVCAAVLATAISFTGCAPAAQAQSSQSSLSSADVKRLAEFSSSVFESLKPGQKVPQTTVTRYVTADGIPRQYDVILPNGFNPSRSYPVIIGYGGWQHNSATARSYQRFEDAAGDRAIVVYAQGIGDSWAGAPYATTTMHNDIQYSREIINDLSRSFRIDRTKVYAAGLSNGGAMAMALACHAPDLVAGVASAAGAYYSPTVTGCARGAVKTLIMHADNDDIVSYEGGDRHGARYESARLVFWNIGTKNGCDMNRVTPRTNGNTTTFTPTGCRVPTEIRKIQGGGHTWFTNPSATHEAVRFFLG